jgi:hypothetical protein
MSSELAQSNAVYESVNGKMEHDMSFTVYM